MNNIKINFEKKLDKIKIMHAVNNGPMGCINDPVEDENIRSNFQYYKMAKIPFARTHDASFFAGYGGEHTVDIHAIFPDFNNNPYNPSSYDFTLTDEYLKNITDAGTKVYYRLGSKIEHWKKKYGTIVPADFNKWAVICEHIIRHYNLGWANGFHYDIEYWEIWNEPDGVNEENGDSPNWSGTPEQYYELYRVSARHLKKCFPTLKIGGPSLSWVGNSKWLQGFLDTIKDDGIETPLDFFSWHSYARIPKSMIDGQNKIRHMLDVNGYKHTEIHVNEWNRLEHGKYVTSIEAMIGMQGAAYVAAAMILGQKSSIDMLMYYDARPNTVFNGMFDFYTLRPLKGYYPFLMFSKIYELGVETESKSDDEDLYVVSATDGVENGAIITYYSNDLTAKDKDVMIEFTGEDIDGIWIVSVLDNENSMKNIEINVVNKKTTISMRANSVVYLSKQIVF